MINPTHDRLATSPTTDSETLRDLATIHSNNKYLLSKIVQNPNIDFDTYLELGRLCPREFVKNPILDLILIENPNIFSEYSELTNAIVMYCDTLPNLVIKYLSNVTNNSHIPYYLIKFPNAPESMFELVVDRGNISSHIQMLKLAHIPEKIISKLWSEHYSQFNSQSLTPGQLNLFYALANHQKSPQHVLIELVQNSNLYVRAALASNPAIPEIVQYSLLKCSFDKIRRTLARNRNISRTILNILLYDNDPQTRSIAAERLGLDLDIPVEFNHN